MASSYPSLPKPLVPLAGIPLIEIAIRGLRKAGFRDIRFSLRHRAGQIIEYLERCSFPGCDGFTFLVEDEPLGTIGALAELQEEDRTVLVTNGDLLSGIDLKNMIQYHRRSGADLTIATHDEFHRLKLGEVVTGTGHRIVEYREKPVKRYRISSGTYLVEPVVPVLLEKGEWLSFPDLVTRALDARLEVVEFFHCEPWLDINDEEDLSRARDMLRKDPVAFGIDPDWLE